MLDKFDSIIINKKEEIEFLEKCLKKDNPFLNKNIQFNLLYRASRDGENSSVFHAKCDNKPNLLFVVQTSKGLKFVGYSEQTWEGESCKEESCKEDVNAFAYSLDYLKKYNSVKGKKIMVPASDRGPRFGPWIIWIGENFLSKSGETCKKESGLKYFEGITKDYELNNGEHRFNLTEFEAFQIIMT
jgi:hypothetical protein